MGAKGRTTRNSSPVKMAVSPVRPPTRMPAKLSPRMMTGLRPRRAERMLPRPHARNTQYAPGRFPSGSTRSAILAIE